ncbi:MAG: hypothetical protein WDO17_19580 [Alphaproteobacteria bacterium]
MSTLQIDVPRYSADFGPPCTECGRPTRLVGVEPHLTKPRTDLHTYECLACDVMQTEVVPLAS